MGEYVQFDRKTILMIFKERMDELFPFCIKSIPQCLVDLWNYQLHDNEVYRKEGVLDFVFDCVIYWEDIEMIKKVFENEDKTLIPIYGASNGKLKVIQYFYEELWNIYGIFEEENEPSLFERVALDTDNVDIIDYLFKRVDNVCWELVLKRAIKKNKFEIVNYLTEKIKK